MAKRRKSSRKSVTRSRQASMRPRGADGRFLTAEQIAALGDVPAKNEQPSPIVTPTVHSHPTSLTQSQNTSAQSRSYPSRERQFPTESRSKPKGKYEDLSPLERAAMRQERRMHRG